MYSNGPGVCSTMYTLKTLLCYSFIVDKVSCSDSSNHMTRFVLCYCEVPRKPVTRLNLCRDSLLF